MSNRVTAIPRSAPTSATTSQPDPIHASVPRDEQRDYSFDELREMPFPPCTTADYATLQDKLFKDGALIALRDPGDAGNIALELLREGRTMVLKWLAAKCSRFTMEVPADEDDPVLLDRMCDWLMTVAQGCSITLRFASLRAFDHVSRATPWRSLEISYLCAAHVLETHGKGCGTEGPRLSPGPGNLHLICKNREAMPTFVRSTLNRSASASLRLKLAGDMGKTVGVELLAPLLRSRSLRALALSQQANMGFEIFEALAVDCANGLQGMSLVLGKIDATAARSLGGFLARSQSLQQLAIECTDLEEAFPELQSGLVSNTSLKAIGFADCTLTADNARRLAAALGKNTCVRKLEFIDTRMKGEGAKEIIEGLRQNEGLRVLELRFGIESDDPDSAQAGIAMANLVRKNPFLRVLIVSVVRYGHPFHGAGHQEFITAAMASPTLWEVRYPFPDPEAAKAHFAENRQRSLALAHAGFTLACSHAQHLLPLEIEGIIITLIEGLGEEDQLSLDGLIELIEGTTMRAAQPVAPPLAPQAVLPNDTDDGVEDPSALPPGMCILV